METGFFHHLGGTGGFINHQRHLANGDHLLSYRKTGSVLVLSIASLVGFLPYALLGPVIGVLVDRYDRKLVMIGADLIIAVAGVVLALIALYMELPVWMIMTVLLIRSVGTAFHSPALSAVTPLIVPEDQLAK